MKIFKSLGVIVATVMLALGIGGGLAPSAFAAKAAPNDGSYSAENLTDRTEVPRTGAVPPSGGGGTAPPASTESLRCWDAYLSGSTFAISCSGNNFYVWADCSNGYRYTVGPFAGSYRVTITCPGGSRALQGGAYGS
ncbi:hypothetical protein AB8O64_18990 [Streptomyces sp. QH1-20]|uniref:hypothetical protein n=1 Tax=Streptomyces sp. QH1-20 TaxID=3240934 RepID=UPI0035129CA6